MIIKPVNVNSLSSSVSWKDKSGNLKFSLQARKSSLFSSILTKNSNDYGFRIVLKTLKGSFVIAVDDAFDKIYETWNWIEVNLMRQENYALTADIENLNVEIDDFLLKKFEELAEQNEGKSNSQPEHVKNILTRYFPNFQDDILLSGTLYILNLEFVCTYIPVDGVGIKGRICITK